MNNLLLDKIEYKIQKTKLGIWRRYLYPTGACFAEFQSYKTFLGLPFFHYTYGICPETGKRVIAKGIIAIGRVAIGVLSIGQASLGIIAIGQAGIGLLFGLGQLSTGIIAIGQIAIAVLFGLGQITCGYMSIGQIAFGKYVIAQIGYGKYVWSSKIKNIEALNFLKKLFSSVL